MDEAGALVERLKGRRFWGKLTICFKGGEIYHYIIEENIKPKNGEKNERRNDYPKD